MSKIILIILIFITLTGCTAHLTESGFITQDKQVIAYSPSDLIQWQNRFPNLQINSLSLKSDDPSVILKGLYIDNPKSKDLIFFIQGNGMRVSPAGIVALETLKTLNKDIVIFDRRGLGASNGQATIENLISDSLLQFQFIKQNFKPNKLIVHGYSLGSFIAGQLAKKVEIDALILQGSATNVNDWIRYQMPWYSKLFVTVEIDDAFNTVDNKEVVTKQYHNPLLIIGGEKDQQVPAELSRLLYSASQSQNKQLIIVDGADHNNMLAGQTEMMKYKNFLNSL